MGRWQDLGEIGPRVLIFGGPYSNLQATQALLAEAQEREIPPASVLCTGDIVAYGADPAATVEAIRRSGCAVIAGNCEKQIAAGSADCGCGFASGSQCDVASAAWYSHASGAIEAEARQWMGDLPDGAVFTMNGARFAGVHGGATAVSRFLWPTSPENEFAEEIAAVTAAVGPVAGIVAGHCGMAFHRTVDEIDWINAGVIGLPPHDGRPETRFVLLDSDGPVIHRLSYDTAAASAAMIANKLTQGYEQSLVSGLWPSEEILPAALQHLEN